MPGGNGRPRPQHAPAPLAQPCARLRTTADVRSGSVPSNCGVQEPKNAGAWAYVQPRIETAMRDTRAVRPLYAGRRAAAAVSTGYKDVHDREQAKLISEALS